MASAQAPTQQIANQVVQAASNPYALKYYGATCVIDVEGAAQVLAVGDLIQKVTWEFKGPVLLRRMHLLVRLIVHLLRL